MREWHSRICLRIVSTNHNAHTVVVYISNKLPVGVHPNPNPERWHAFLTNRSCCSAGSHPRTPLSTTSLDYSGHGHTFTRTLLQIYTVHKRQNPIRSRQYFAKHSRRLIASRAGQDTRSKPTGLQSATPPGKQIAEITPNGEETVLCRRWSGQRVLALWLVSLSAMASMGASHDTHT